MERTTSRPEIGESPPEIVARARHSSTAPPGPKGFAARARRGVSLVEITIVVIILGVLFAMAAPSFRRSMEQSHADISGANLRAIWTAERLYWLEYRTFTDSLSDLASLDLIDASLVSSSEPYAYTLSTGADATTFTATATRAGSTVWTGSFSINETGALTGTVSDGRGISIDPGFLD